MQVEKPIYGGNFTVTDAVEGGTTLPFVLPGERVDPAGNVLAPSPDRVQAACLHFGSCGGCHYQHGTYARQTEWKTSILQDLAARANVTLPPIQLNTAEPSGHRNRIRLRVETTPQGLSVGYSRRASNDFLPIAMCPIAAPILWQAAKAFLALAREGFPSWAENLSAIEFFCTPDESRLQAQFLFREAGPEQKRKGVFADFCGRLKALLPQLAGAGVGLDPELNRRVRLSWPGETWGAAGLLYAVAGRDYWVSRGAFFQVNRFLVERLVELVCGDAEAALAWDLFAGVGLFSRVLAERWARVIAVEGGEIAAADLAASAKKFAFTSRRMATLDFLREQQTQRERPDLVVLDPPRAGLGLEGAGVLARLAPARIVYVSCDPVTLMRDLAILLRGGYTVESAHLIDLFPQTFHIETVVKLKRM